MTASPAAPRYYLQEQLNVASGRITYEIVDSTSGRVVKRERAWKTAHQLLDGFNADATRETPSTTTRSNP